MNIVAIIPASGLGTRMGKSIPKQFLKIDKKAILTHTISKFELCKRIGEIIVTVPKNMPSTFRKNILSTIKNSSRIKVIGGGDTRQDSVYKALQELDERVDVVVIHDGVRPLVSIDLIEDSIESAIKFDAVVPIIPIKDTVKILSEDGSILNTLDRSKLVLIQTPQAFRYKILKKAYERAFNDGFYGTDDAQLVEKMGIKVRTIQGDHKNIKITTREDIAMAEYFLKKRKAFTL